MRDLWLRGVVRGRAWTTTTQADPATERAADLVHRHFNRHPPESAVGVGFHRCGHMGRLRLRGLVIDVFARRIVGWRLSTSPRADFVLDALEQAIDGRGDHTVGDLVHHSDRGSQYLSMRYTVRLTDAGIEPSVGSRGDSHDALAESVIGLFEAEVIRRKGPWRTLEAVEFATLTWIDRFNHRRLLGPIGFVPPAEYEARYDEQAAAA